MKRKTAITILLAAAITISMLAGCGKAATNSTASAASSAGSTAESTAESTTDSTVGQDYSAPTTTEWNDMCGKVDKAVLVKLPGADSVSDSMTESIQDDTEQPEAAATAAKNVSGGFIFTDTAVLSAASAAASTDASSAGTDSSSDGSKAATPDEKAPEDGGQEYELSADELSSAKQLLVGLSDSMTFVKNDAYGMQKYKLDFYTGDEKTVQFLMDGDSIYLLSADGDRIVLNDDFNKWFADLASSKFQA